MPYRELGGDVAFLFREYDGSKYGRAAWAEAGWDYIMTGQFAPPRKYRLPNARPNDTEVYGQTRFGVQIGPHFLFQ